MRFYYSVKINVYLTNRTEATISSTHLDNGAREHKRQLRLQLRRQRRALGPAQQRRAARALEHTILSSGLLQRRGSVAAYRASDGEIDPAPLIARLQRLGRQCFLPLILPGGILRFARYRAGQPLTRNRFGIDEPSKSGRLRKGWSVNTVFLPLVGFDRLGGRLGMGGGYYDRSFRNTRAIQAARLVGLAHRDQEVLQLPHQSWDVELSAVATDDEFIVLS